MIKIEYRLKGNNLYSVEVPVLFVGLADECPEDTYLLDVEDNSYPYVETVLIPSHNLGASHFYDF